MSSIVGAITGGGDSGVNFRAKSADLITPVTKQQLDESYGNVNTGLQTQMDFVKALQAQNGIQNQSNVFNQLQGVASGQGPNPAQAMLNNATGANVANQAALMAGQRGSGANAGMMARQAAQAGAGIQQNAIGQGAALQAQQSLGALNQLGGIAGQQVNQQQQATQGYNQFAQNAQGNLLNAATGFNNANVNMQGNMNSANAQLANTVAGGQMNLVGNLMGAAGSAMMLPAGAGGAGAGGGGGGLAAAGKGIGQYMMMADGGKVPSKGPRSKAGQHMMAIGDKVPALVSPGEKYLDPNDVQKVKQGANPMAVSEVIPGEPKVPGAKDSYANDTVPMTLEEGGIVIPRSVTKSKNPDAKAAEFVKAVMMRKRK